MNKRIGDIVDVESPNGVYQIEIIDIKQFVKKCKQLAKASFFIVKIGKCGYNNIIKNSPFAIFDSKPVNEQLFEKQIKLAKSTNLRIFNNNSK